MNSQCHRNSDREIGGIDGKHLDPDPGEILLRSLNSGKSKGATVQSPHNSFVRLSNLFGSRLVSNGGGGGSRTFPHSLLSVTCRFHDGKKVLKGRECRSNRTRIVHRATPATHRLSQSGVRFLWRPWFQQCSRPNLVCFLHE